MMLLLMMRLCMCCCCCCLWCACSLWCAVEFRCVQLAARILRTELYTERKCVWGCVEVMPSASASASASASVKKKAAAPVVVEVVPARKAPVWPTQLDGLLFTPPQPHKVGGSASADAASNGGGGGQAYLARAVVQPVKASMLLRVPAAQVMRIAESRRNTVTVYARVSQPVLRFLIELDARAVDAAKSNVDAWFAHSISAQLVEEYYHGHTTADRQRGTMVARFVIEGRLPAALTSAAPPPPLELKLTLTGMLFRRQHFVCVWKASSATAAHPVSIQELDSRARGGGSMRGFPLVPMFIEDGEEEEGCYSEEEGDEEEEENEEEAEEEEEPAPSFEEYAEIRAELVSCIEASEKSAVARVHALRELQQSMESARIDDMALYEDVRARLQTLSHEGHESQEGRA